MKVGTESLGSEDVFVQEPLVAMPFAPFVAMPGAPNVASCYY